MKKHNKYILFTIMVSGISIFCCTLIRALSVYAAIEDRVAVRVPESCSISSSVDSAHAAEVRNGLYYVDIGETTITITCNDKDGFSIYAIGYSDEELGNTALINDANPDLRIATGTATSGDNSNWAMKLSEIANVDSPTILSDSSGSFSMYHTIPNEFTKVVTHTSTTEFPSGVSFKTTYAAYISDTQIAGTYEGKVKYVMVHPSDNPEPYTPVAIDCEARKICYYPNSNSYEGTMGKQTTSDSSQSITDNSTVTLLASNYSQAGYGFAGWNDKHDYTGNFYGPNETITVPVGTTENGLSLYAVWAKSEGNLQDLTTAGSVCNRLTAATSNSQIGMNSISALTDARDGQTYAIAKLADEKCWMIENLRLDAEGSMFGSLSQGYDSSFIGLANPEPFTSFDDVDTSNSLYTAEAGIDGKITISGLSANNRFPRYSAINTYSRPINPVTNSTGSLTAEGMYSFGNYYTWAAAVADTSSNSDYTSKATSICPKGWRIPTGGANGEFYNLNLNANLGDTNTSAGLRAFPTNLVYSGFIGNGVINNRGFYGHYWTSSPNGANYVYYLYFQKDYNNPGLSFNNGYYGRSIRCLLDI